MKDREHNQSQAIIPGPIKRLAHRVCEGGFLHAKVRDFVVSKSSDQSYGLVGQVGSYAFLVISSKF